MSNFFTESEIESLIQEPKHILVTDFNNLYRFSKEKAQHKEQEISIHRTTDEDSFFKILIRCSKQNPLDFTVILAIAFKNSNQFFKLRRYNGKSHRHFNKLEKESFYDFHIHQATERYQIEGFNKEELFAVQTDKYSDLFGAINLFIDECNIIIPPGVNKPMF